ncbi:hypothetical protein [Lactobacillus selangorensis]|uniref:hypothetical protein n=1 Tax=Lactobacillus selangorensis TaxID=81857 RepID=UPI00070E6C60|nr:hypothetical protein [Lactobacillus selangorensis]
MDANLSILSDAMQQQITDRIIETNRKAVLQWLESFQQPLLTPKQAETYINGSSKKLHELEVAGLKRVQVGPQWVRYDRRDIDKILLKFKI